MSKEMLINVSEGEECRIALVEGGKLEELYMERTSSTSHVGNVYKGRVTNVEPSIQAAFIDFGLGRNGFLHISDLMPQYFGRRGDDVQEAVGRKISRRDRPPIQRCLRRGDEIIVQIIKEGIGTKGPTLSSYVSIPGRILVMMPGMSKLGVSRKIEDEEERRRLRQILDSLKPPKECGFIIRTAGVGKTKAEIQKDLMYLTRLWQNMDKKIKSTPPPVELYTEGDLVTRTVRDVFTPDIDRIVVDNKDVAERIKDFIKIAMPRTKNKVELYTDPVPLFHKFGIEREIELMYSRTVPLPSGGSLVIDSTEAIVAIDVNSGKFRDHSDAEMTAFKTDMEAADEIARQLRLRDLGGVIICDFIDLRFERHRRDLERRLHDHLQNDRAKTKMLRMSQFGIIEMTRQRMRPSLKRSVYFDCPHCKGAGLVKTPESMALDVMRRLAIAAHDQRVDRVELAVHPEVAFYLQNRKRVSLADLEQDAGKRIVVRGDQSLGMDEARLELFDTRDGLVFLTELGMAPPLPAGARPPQAVGRHAQRQIPAPQGRRDERDEARRDGGREGGRDRGREAQPAGRGDRARQPQGRGPGGRGDQRDDRHDAGRDARRDGRGGARPQQPSRRPELDEPEERYDLESVEDAVEQREEEILEHAAPRELAPASRPPMRSLPVEDHIEAPDERSEAFHGADDAAEPMDLEQAPAAFDEPAPAVQTRSSQDRTGDGDRGPSRGQSRGGRSRGRGRGRGRGRDADAAATAAPAGRRQDSEEPDDLDIEPAPAPIEAEAPAGDEGIEATFEAVPAPSAEAAPAGESAEEEGPRKKKTRRGSRGGRGRSRKKAAPAVAHASVSAAASEAAKTPSRSTPPATTVRTGSTDRHLISDEPILPPPVSRPRTYRDLDHIPDDLD